MSNPPFQSMGPPLPAAASQPAKPMNLQPANNAPIKGDAIVPPQQQPQPAPAQGAPMPPPQAQQPQPQQPQPPAPPAPPPGPVPPWVLNGPGTQNPVMNKPGESAIVNDANIPPPQNPRPSPNTPQPAQTDQVGVPPTPGLASFYPPAVKTSMQVPTEVDHKAVRIVPMSQSGEEVWDSLQTRYKARKHAQIKKASHTSPFAESFVQRLVELGKTSAQITQLIKQASAIAPEIAEELANVEVEDVPEQKQAAGAQSLVQGLGKLWNRGAQSFRQAGANLGNSLASRYQSLRPNTRQALGNAWDYAKNFGAGYMQGDAADLASGLSNIAGRQSYSSPWSLSPMRFAQGLGRIKPVTDWVAKQPEWLRGAHAIATGHDPGQLTSAWRHPVNALRAIQPFTTVGQFAPMASQLLTGSTDTPLTHLGNMMNPIGATSYLPWVYERAQNMPQELANKAVENYVQKTTGYNPEQVSQLVGGMKQRLGNFAMSPQGRMVDAFVQNGVPGLMSEGMGGMVGPNALPYLASMMQMPGFQLPPMLSPNAPGAGAVQGSMPRFAMPGQVQLAPGVPGNMESPYKPI